MSTSRRSFLKALCAVPIGIALTRWTEALTQAVIELWEGRKLVAVRPIAMTTAWATFTYDLGPEEAARIEDWTDLTVRLTTNGAPLEVGYIEMEMPPPATWRMPPRSRHARKRDREWRERRAARPSQA